MKKIDKLYPLKINISGTDYTPIGHLINSRTSERITNPLENPAIRKLARIASLCNESSVFYSSNKLETCGMPTEIALRVMALKFGLREIDSRRVHFFDFDRQRKMMSSIDLFDDSGCENKKSSSKEKLRKKLVCHLKGAPENVLERCTYAISYGGELVELTPEIKKTLTDAVMAMALEGLRTIALAFKNIDEVGRKELKELNKTDKVAEYCEDEESEELGAEYSHEKGLVLAGFVGISDPPRAEVKASVAECRRAGVEVKVVTGDHQATAEAVCRQIGLFDPQETDLKTRSMTGSQFSLLSAAEKADAARNITLIAFTNDIINGLS